MAEERIRGEGTRTTRAGVRVRDTVSLMGRSVSRFVPVFYQRIRQDLVLFCYLGIWEVKELIALGSNCSKSRGLAAQ